MHTNFKWKNYIKSWIFSLNGILGRCSWQNSDWWALAEVYYIYHALSSCHSIIFIFVQYKYKYVILSTKKLTKPLPSFLFIQCKSHCARYFQSIFLTYLHYSCMFVSSYLLLLVKWLCTSAVCDMHPQAVRRSIGAPVTLFVRVPVPFALLSQ